MYLINHLKVQINGKYLKVRITLHINNSTTKITLIKMATRTEHSIQIPIMIDRIISSKSLGIIKIDHLQIEIPAIAILESNKEINEIINQLRIENIINYLTSKRRNNLIVTEVVISKLRGNIPERRGSMKLNRKFIHQYMYLRCME